MGSNLDEKEEGKVDIYCGALYLALRYSAKGVISVPHR